MCMEHLEKPLMGPLCYTISNKATWTEVTHRRAGN